MIFLPRPGSHTGSGHGLSSGVERYGTQVRERRNEGSLISRPEQPIELIVRSSLFDSMRSNTFLPLIFRQALGETAEASRTEPDGLLCRGRI